MTEPLPETGAPLDRPARCRACGAMGAAGDTFCTFCGAPLHADTAVPPGAVSARMSRPPRTVGSKVVIALGATLVTSAVLFAFVMAIYRPSDAGPRGDRGTATASAALASPVPTIDPAELGEPFGRMIGATDTRCGPDLVCQLIEVPLDLDAPEGGDTLELRFGIHQAESPEVTDVLVIATGGPGTSGVTEAPRFLNTFPANVLERYDLVFFEQRGVGRSSIHCYEAEAERDQAWGSLLSLSDAAAVDAAEQWVRECMRDSGVRSVEVFDHYSTYHAAADLDAFLDHIGAGKVVIYGESYGTEFAQTYAAHRPDRVRGLVLDAVVDPTMDPVDAAVQRAESFADVLDRVFDSCLDDPTCASAFGPGGPAATWDAVSDRLTDGPIELEVTDRTGEPRTAFLTRANLLDATSGTLYTERERAILVRALAFAEREEFDYLYRLVYAMYGVEPGDDENLWATTAPFHIIRCQAYPTDVLARMARLSSEFQRMQAEGNRLAEFVADELPCLGGFAGARPAKPVPPLTDTDFPVLVLTSTADPPTPDAWARAVAERTPNAVLFVTQDSSHGTYGWGVPCPDEHVNEFLITGDVPEDDTVDCEYGYLTDVFTPLPRGGPDEYPDLLAALIAVEETVFALPEYLYWSGARTTAGCPGGGTITLTYRGEEHFELDGCDLLGGWPMDGSIELSEDFTTTMSLTVRNGRIEYTYGDAGPTVTGEIDGEEININR